MIFWTHFIIPDNCDAQLCLHLDELYSPRERLELSRFSVPKRRSEWLASRYALKALARASLPQIALIPPSQIEILKEPGGAPYIVLQGISRLPNQISLSHSHNRVLCGITSNPSPPFGLDIEHIEPRSPEFVQDYFTRAETAAVLSLPPAGQEAAITLIWSAKEAVLKALQKGLSLDTRSIQIDILRQHPSNRATWQEIPISVIGAWTGSWRLLWRREADFILTLCIPADLPIALEPIVLQI